MKKTILSSCLLVLALSSLGAHAQTGADEGEPIIPGAEDLPGAWQLQISSDAMDDSKVVMMHLIARNPDAMLTFMCSTRPSPSVRLAVSPRGFYLGDSNETTSMMVRFGDEPSEEIQMYQSGSSAVIWDETQVLKVAKNIANANRISFRLFSYRNTKTDVTFDTQGSEIAIPRFLNECDIG